MEIEDQIEWDKYLIPGTNTLINKYNIEDLELLKEKEEEIVFEKLTYLYLNPISGNFDPKHLIDIHKFIFKDIYRFAGIYRTCSLQKDSHIFLNPKEIEKNLEEKLKEMNQEFDSNDIYSKEEFAFKLAKYYYEVMYIHPFREGNGRSIRVFFRDFVKEKSKNKLCGELDLDYTMMDSRNLMLGTANRYIYSSYIENEFIKGLVEVKMKVKK